jgi:hypothetical protein
MSRLAWVLSLAAFLGPLAWAAAKPEKAVQSAAAACLKLCEMRDAREKLTF